MNYEVHIPSVLLIGADTRKNVGNLAIQLGMKNVLLVSDKFLESIGLVSEIYGILKASGIEPIVFTDIAGEPEIGNLLDAMETVGTNKCDGIVSVGGGASIDTAKAVSVLLTNGGVMSDYMGVGKVPKAGLPHIAIPTTAGTGSEVTRVTIITDNQTNIKMMCLDNAFMPTSAIVDYKLSMTMPKSLTSYVGIDALTHAIEAYVSRKANPVSDIFAVKAIALISGSILTSYNVPTDEAVRSAMMEGATFAGAAFSNASVCTVHGMSRPIGAHFHVAHGLSNAMLLPIVTEYSIEGNPARYAEIAGIMGLPGASEKGLTDALVNRLHEFNKLMHVPTPATYGIDKDCYMSVLSDMADAAIASGSPGNNPKVFTKDEIIDLYKKVYK